MACLAKLFLKAFFLFVFCILLFPIQHYLYSISFQIKEKKKKSKKSGEGRTPLREELDPSELFRYSSFVPGDKTKEEAEKELRTICKVFDFPVEDLLLDSKEKDQNSEGAEETPEVK